MASRLYVMLGAPGAGKGTQATILAERLGIPHVASGELFRAAVREGTALGREAKAAMDGGTLVSDDLVIRLVLDRLAQPDTAAGAILDGFPRTGPQAEALDAELAGRDGRVSGALYVEVGEPELLRRLSGRWLCRAAGHSYHAADHPPAREGVCDIDDSELYQRDDDRPATVRVRLERQLAPMYDVVEHYRARRVLAAVDGERSIAAVTEALLRAIAQLPDDPAMVFGERRVTLKSQPQIERMARAGRLVADVLDRLAAEVRPGITTLHLDATAHEMITAAGATPSFVGVPGIKSPYRHATCVSIDDEVVHGIPSASRVIRDGSLVSVDVGAIVEGWHGDGARTFIVGEVPERARALVAATREAMLAGIAAARPGNHIGDISAAVEDVALANGLGVVRPFVGHGIGTEMHEAPQVPNYRLASRGRRLEPGLCLAIEPMFTLGQHAVKVDDDGWTVRTVDGGWAAHFEHSIVVTAGGPRILTSNELAKAGLPLGAAT